MISWVNVLKNNSNSPLFRGNQEKYFYANIKYCNLTRSTSPLELKKS